MKRLDVGAQWFKPGINAEKDYNLKLPRIAPERDPAAEATCKALRSHKVGPWELTTVREWEQRRLLYQQEF